MVRQNCSWKLLLLWGIFAPLVPSSARAQEAIQEVRWRHDYPTARKEAQEKSLPLVIDFGTKNCFWCKKLDETTLRDPVVVNTINERFVALRVDAEQERQLAQFLRISSYPTVVLASPDGRILSTLEGYHEAPPFHENLQRVLASLTPPDWMQRDLQNAAKWAASGDYSRAIPALRGILEDGKGRPLQTSAQKMMDDIERKAQERVARARQLQEKGQSSEAVEILTETVRVFPGLQSSRDATELLGRLAQNTEYRAQQRGKRAKDLLTQAQEFYRSKDYIPCLDRCEILLGHYGDLPEGQEAAVLAQEIRSNAEWLQNAADTMADRLGLLYLSLADTLLKRGQVQRGEYYLQRVIQAFPGSRQAEAAQLRLNQLNGNLPRNQVQSAGP
jgi:thioredoxin-like negative regulator of GroEL